MQVFHARTVVLDPQPQRAVDAAMAVAPRFEEVFMGLEWLLARSPGRGLKGRINDQTVWVYVQGGDRTADTPELWVVYTYDDEQVVIRALRVLHP